MTKRFQRIGDYLVVVVALLSTFLGGSIFSLKWGFFAFILILLMSGMLKWRMLSYRLVNLYMFGVMAVSAVLSWLEWADGRTDFINPLGWSVIALVFGLLWVDSRRKTKSDESAE